MPRRGIKETVTANWRPPILQRLLPAALAAPLVLSLTGCIDVNRFLVRAEGKPPKAPDAGLQAAPEPIPAPQEKPKPGKLYEWNGDGRQVSRIVVNTDEQKARFYDGDEQIGWTTVASGVSKFPTPTGRFEVMEKVANKRSNLYGKIYGAGGRVMRADAKAGRDPVPAGARFEGASMPYFLRLTNDGIGLHAGPIPRPGRPASHGCIRMPSKLAPVLFSHVGLGTKVSIVGAGPDYGDYVQKQRALAARERERREAAARQQAVAAATSEATPAEASPTSPPTSAATPPEGPQVGRTQEAVNPNKAPFPGPEAMEPRPTGVVTSSADPAPVSVRPAETAGPASVLPIAQTAAAHPSPSPLPTAPAPTSTAPMPGYPSLLPPSAVAPPYAPPMWPAAATLPATTPIASPSPVAPSSLPPVSTPGAVPVSVPIPSPPAAPIEAQATPAAPLPAPSAEKSPADEEAEEG